MPRASSILACALLILSALRLCPAAEGDPAAPGKKGTAKKPPSATDPNRLSDKELKKRWGELQARRLKIMQAMEQIQADFEMAKGIEQQKKVQIRFEELNAEFQREIAPPMNELAEAVNRKDPSDPTAAQIMVGRLLPERPRMLAPGQPRPQVPDENYARIVALVSGLTREDAETRATIENILGVIIEDKRFAEAAAITERLVDAQGVTPRILLLAGLAQLYLSDFDRALALAQRAAAQGGMSPETAEFVQSCSDYVAFWKKEQELRAQEQQTDDLPRVLLKTTQGDIVLELFENEAPNTTANFISLVEAHKYDRLPFHRYEPNFVIQGGAINPDGKDRRNPERGGPGYAIACECYNDKARMHFRGSLSMAHGGKDTGGSQFFIAHTPLPHLNWAPKKKRNNHTVFGRVVDGLDVALSLRGGDKIESAKVIRKRDHAYVPETLDDVPPPATSRRKAKSEDAVRK